MTRRLTLMMLALIGGSLAVAQAQSGGARMRALLEPIQEVPAVSSAASGTFRAAIDERGELVVYELTYADLEADILQAHIHTAQRGVNGGIMVWLCGTAALPGPSGTPACPGPRDGTVTGEITPSSVIGPAGQGIAAGEFREFLETIRNGVAYANVHSEKFPGGEIRGQIRPGQ